MPDLICQHCHRPFSPKPGIKPRFCKTACRVAANRARHRSKLALTLAEPEPTPTHEQPTVTHEPTVQPPAPIPQPPAQPAPAPAPAKPKDPALYRLSPEYRALFPPNTTFLPANHPIPHYRGLAIPANINPSAYEPIQPKLFPLARPQSAQPLKAFLANTDPHQHP